jgi:hypothetical protein
MLLFRSAVTVLHRVALAFSMTFECGRPLSTISIVPLSRRGCPPSSISVTPPFVAAFCSARIAFSTEAVIAHARSVTAFSTRLVATFPAGATTRNIHFYDENLNDESEIVIKITFYDKNFGFIIDHR